MKKNTIIMILVLALVFSFAACSVPSTSDESTTTTTTVDESDSDSTEVAEEATEDTAEKILYLASLQDPDSLDPQLGNSNYDTIITIGLYEGLVNYHDGEYLPGVAEEWTVSDDALVYTFYLREDSTWSDGEAVTAQDFVDTFQLLVSRTEASGVSYLASPILNADEIIAGEMEKEELGVVALDDYTLQITLKAPTSYFLSLVSFTTFFPVRADLLEEYGEAYASSVDTLVSNGPFKLVEMEAQNQYVLVKNEDYWNAENISLDGATIYIIPDSSTQMNMFETGEIDVVDISSEYLQDYMDAGIANSFNNGSVYFLQLSGVGTTEENGAIINNTNFKMALSYSIDREAFVEAVFNNDGSNPSVRQVIDEVVAYDGVYYGDLFSDYVSPHPLSADAEIANEYLALALEELGYDSVEDLPVLDFLISDRESDRLVAEYIQDAILTTLGVETEIRVLTFAQKYDEMATFNYDLGWAGWGPDYNDANTYLDMFMSTGYAGAYIGWTSEEYDALIDEATNLPDGEERANVLFEAEQYLLEYGPIIPVYTAGSSWAVQDNVTGIIKNFVGAETDYIYADKTVD